MKQTNICGIDFDETLFMTLDAWGESFTKLTGLPFPDKVEEYDFSDVFDPYTASQMWKARTPDLYRSDLVYPNADAMWLVDWFEEHGWTVVVPTHDVESFVEVKEQLLAAYYPTLSGKLVLARDKWAAVPAMSLLIDDAPHSSASAYPSRAYNKGVPAHLRFDDLRDVPERLGLSDWKVDRFVDGLRFSSRMATSYRPIVEDPMHRPWPTRFQPVERPPVNPYVLARRF